MPDDRPMFGRDVPDAAWRPTPELLTDARLAGFLRSTGERGLDALQARAAADPAWFWGAAVTDLGLDWQRQPTEIMDAAGGPEWTRWWRGGAFNVPGGIPSCYGYRVFETVVPIRNMIWRQG